MWDGVLCRSEIKIIKFISDPIIFLSMSSKFADLHKDVLKMNGFAVIEWKGREITKARLNAYYNVQFLLDKLMARLKAKTEAINEIERLMISRECAEFWGDF